LGGKLLRGKCFFSAKCSPCGHNTGTCEKQTIFRMGIHQIPELSQVAGAQSIDLTASLTQT